MIDDEDAVRLFNERGETPSERAERLRFELNMDYMMEFEDFDQYEMCFRSGIMPPTEEM